MEVQQHYEAIRQLGGDVVSIVLARPETVKLFLEDHPLPFPLLADPTREAYAAFGLQRTSWFTILRPDVVLRYLKMIWQGWRPRRSKKGEDVLQLGGDFVFDREGRLVFAYRSSEPTDRPKPEVLLEALSQRES